MSSNLLSSHPWLISHVNRVQQVETRYRDMMIALPLENIVTIVVRVARAADTRKYDYAAKGVTLPPLPQSLTTQHLLGGGIWHPPHHPLGPPNPPPPTPTP